MKRPARKRKPARKTKARPPARAKPVVALTPAAPAPEPSETAKPANLEPEAWRFVLEYVRLGANGTRAYVAVHPDVQLNSAATEAWRLLRKPEIQNALSLVRSELWKRLEMSGEEALALLSLSARADIGDAYGPDGQLLPVREWPDSLRLAVKQIKPGEWGNTITLHDGLKARELMAIAQGRLKQQHEVRVSRTLEEIVAGVTPEAARD